MHKTDNKDKFFLYCVIIIISMTRAHERTANYNLLELFSGKVTTV